LAGNRFRLPGRWGTRVRRAHRAGQADVAAHAWRIPARDLDPPGAAAVGPGTTKCERTTKHERTTKYPDGWRPGDSLPVGFAIRSSLGATATNGAAIGRRRDGDIFAAARADCESV